MKKFLTILLAIAMVICLMACDSEEDVEKKETKRKVAQGSAEESSVDVIIHAINGVEISLDAITWQTKITTADFDAAIKNKKLLTQYPIDEMEPISSAGDVVDGKLNIFAGGYMEDGSLYSSKIEEQRGYGGDFFAFDIFFKSDISQELTLNVGPLSSFADLPALRVGFIPMGTATQGEDPYDLTQETGTALIWEPNSTVDYTGEARAKEEYSGFCTSFDGISELQLSDSEVKPVTTFDEDHLIISLQKGISKVRVYIWIEGQDVDCVSNTSFLSIESIQLTFSGE